MQPLLITCYVLILGYTILMVLYSIGWRLQRNFKPPNTNKNAKTFISIIIPARNEAGNIAASLNAILAQTYPKELFEIIVVDDHSDDNTADIVSSYANGNVRCISLADELVADTQLIAYKKQAIATGIAASKGTLIVTTDADCIAPQDWLRNITALYEEDHPVMIAAPVQFTNNDSLIQLFQSLDFMTMQGITAAAHRLKLGNMCNGANLAFEKAAYESVNGYAGIDHISSGDDYLLMMKLNNSFPGRIAYLKSAEAIVSTAPQPDLGSFLQQRIRWASKSGKYNDPRLTFVLVWVYLFNLSLLTLMAVAAFHPGLTLPALILILVKTAIELLLLVPVATFFNKRKELRYFLVLQPLHISYIVVAGLLGLIGTYSWKGRKTK